MAKAHARLQQQRVALLKYVYQMDAVIAPLLLPAILKLAHQQLLKCRGMQTKGVYQKYF